MPSRAKPSASPVVSKDRIHLAWCIRSDW